MTFRIVLWKTGLVEFRQLFGGIINLFVMVNVHLMYFSKVRTWGHGRF